MTSPTRPHGRPLDLWIRTDPSTLAAIEAVARESFTSRAGLIRRFIAEGLASAGHPVSDASPITPHVSGATR